METSVVVGSVDSPLGPLGLILSSRGLCRLTFATEATSACDTWLRRWMPHASVLGDGERLDDVACQLQAYFRGELSTFTLPLDLRGTPFQLEVWQAVSAIPCGQVRSYAQIAATIGRPNAVRAVGAANGANPIPIIVPCHRVIGSDGSLVKYGGGTAVKQRLLRLEGATVDDFHLVHAQSG